LQAGALFVTPAVLTAKLLAADMRCDDPISPPTGNFKGTGVLLTGKIFGAGSLGEGPLSLLTGNFKKSGS